MGWLRTVCVIAVIALSAVACSGSELESEPTVPPETPVVVPNPSPSPSPTASVPPTAEERDVFTLAVRLCSSTTASQLVSQFGLQPDRFATAFANRFRTDLHEEAFQGCLEGLERAGRKEKKKGKETR